MGRRCIILPCGGSGSRLALPYPKELHFVLPGKAMIDLTIELFGHLEAPFHVLVVLRPEKQALHDYLAGRWPGIEFHFLDQAEPNFIGALKTCQTSLTDYNLILLPDQSLSGSGCLERMFKLLECGAPAAVLAHRRTNRASLADEGALKIIDGRLAGMAEKPGSAFACEFDAAWCGLGFRGDAAAAFFESLERLYEVGRLDGSDWESSPLCDAPACFVDDFTDLGVWERLSAFQRAKSHEA